MSKVEENSAKSIAIKEVNKRIVSKDQAKVNYINWIESSLKSGYFSDNIKNFWKEVINEVKNL